jgi:hypothetical protein
MGITPFRDLRTDTYVHVYVERCRSLRQRLLALIATKSISKDCLVDFVLAWSYTALTMLRKCCIVTFVSLS